MLSAKRALAGPHLHLPRINITLEGNLDVAAMAAAFISQFHFSLEGPEKSEP